MPKTPPKPVKCARKVFLDQNDNRGTDEQQGNIKEHFLADIRDIMKIWKIPTSQEKTIDSSPKVGDVLELSRKETFLLECSAFLFL